jgi:hypothetical protein
LRATVRRHEFGRTAPPHVAARQRACRNELPEID